MIAVIAFILAIVVFLVMFLGGHVGGSRQQIDLITDGDADIHLEADKMGYRATEIPYDD